MSELDDIRARRAAAERDPRNYTGRMLADIDTLLAMVDALTGERDAALETLAQANAITQEANRLGEKSLALSTANTAKINQVLELVRALTAERDALAAQLAQAQRELAEIQRDWA